MISRILVVAAFLGMAAVPAILAYNAGFLPSPQQASAESTGPASTSSVAVTTLVWPDEPLGLAASDSKIYWAQRDRSIAVAGIWSYDVASGERELLLGRRGGAGKAGGFPAAGGHLLAWEAWETRRGDGVPGIQALDTDLHHRWRVAQAGREPRVAGDVVYWVEPGGAGDGDVIRGVNALTDAEYALDAGGRVTELAGWGPWAAWIAGRGSAAEVWAGSFSGAARYRLAAKGRAVAMDRERILWAAAVGRHSTAIVSWNRRSTRSKVLCRLPGTASSLSMSRDHAVWVLDRKATGPQVWYYDFKLGEARQISEAGGRQVSPVIVAGSVYWADDRSGRWELYSHTLSR